MQSEQFGLQIASLTKENQMLKDSNILNACKITGMKESIRALDDKVMDNKTQNLKLRDELKMYKQHCCTQDINEKALKKRNADNDDEILLLKREIQKLEARLKDNERATAEAAKSKEKTTRYQNKLSEARTEISLDKQENDNLHCTVMRQAAEIKSKTTELEKATFQYESEKCKLASCQNRLDKLRKEMEDFRDITDKDNQKTSCDLKKLESQIEKLQFEASQYEEWDIRQKQQISELQSVLLEKEAEITKERRENMLLKGRCAGAESDTEDLPKRPFCSAVSSRREGSSSRCQIEYPKPRQKPQQKPQQKDQQDNQDKMMKGQNGMLEQMKDQDVHKQCRQKIKELKLSENVYSCIERGLTEKLNEKTKEIRCLRIQLKELQRKKQPIRPKTLTRTKHRVQAIH
ncbi:Hypothetical predicted protein [Xyrichtys novacula]|uniref:Uncharacterized protein n=1 Tax=Xyrichtys novacula TaxID=13765 RepID=A0AAV1EZE9_XYRNO|nr:Hypothetical predicted protein [Xyrichtys novacula]